MQPTNRQWIPRATLTATAVLMGAWWYVERPELSAGNRGGANPLPPPERVAFEPPSRRIAWQVFTPAAPAPEAAADPGPRFRLAGTFVQRLPEMQEDEGVRYAIIDDLDAGRQHLVPVGKEILGWQLVDMTADTATLQRGPVRRVLRRSFAELAATTPDGASPGEGPSPDRIPFWDQPALETSRFGKRIAEDRWVFRRDKVMEYYDEMIQTPERLISLYASFRPDRDAEGSVAGFQIAMAGEQSFFQAVGLQEGDVVRRVNSMRMTSQRRAEFMISEFVRNGLNAVVFDIERDGKETQLIYLIHDPDNPIRSDDQE